MTHASDDYDDDVRPFPEGDTPPVVDWDHVNDLTACWLHEFDWIRLRGEETP